MSEPKFDAIQEAVLENVLQFCENGEAAICEKVDAAEAAYVEQGRDLSEIKASPNHSLCRKDAKQFRARIAELEAEMRQCGDPVHDGEGM